MARVVLCCAVLCCVVLHCGALRCHAASHAAAFDRSILFCSPREQYLTNPTPSGNVPSVNPEPRWEDPLKKHLHGYGRSMLDATAKNEDPTCEELELSISSLHENGMDTRLPPFPAPRTNTREA